MTPCPSCRRCRQQKLKCSRDSPTCKRCQSIAAICEYPPPPNRKALAAERVRKAKARTELEAGTAALVQDRHLLSNAAAPGIEVQGISSILAGPQETTNSNVDSSEKHQAVHRRIQPNPEERRPRAAAAALHASLRTASLPSPEVAVFLFEIYFSRVYNASLLFHKKTFLSEYFANQVPDFVALSIFALASIFLRQPSGPPRQDRGENGAGFGISMLASADSANQGFEWATAASQRVLMQADIPCLETVQACQNLALYWFAAGQTGRTHMHAYVAYKTARLLIFPLQQNPNNEPEHLRLRNELERRCFWSCWITSCISQENATFKSDPWKETVGLWFPSDEDSWTVENPIPTEFFGNDGTIGSRGPSNFARPPSIMGELIKFFCLWWEIQHFGKSQNETAWTNPSTRLAILFELDRRLKELFAHLHPSLRNLDARSFLSQSLDTARLFSVHILYNLCACALHCSIVPLFSNTAMKPPVSSRIVQLSVEESVNHAASILDLATSFLENNPDASRLPSITGHAMFVAITVHFRSLVAQRKLQNQSVGRFKAAVSILASLKEYWSTHQDSWRLLELLFASKGLDLDSISTSAFQLQKNSDDGPTNVEQIVSQNVLDQDAGSIRIFTYVPDEESKGDSSPRRSSASASVNLMRRASAYSNSNTNSVIPDRTSQSKHSTQDSSQGPRTSPRPSPFSAENPHITQPYTRYPDPQIRPSPPHVVQNTEKSFSNSPHAVHQDFAGMNTGMQTSFSPLADVSEGQGQSHNHSGQNMVDFSDESGVMDTRMVEGVDVWWSQPLDDSIMNQWPEGGALYQFERFPFGI